MSDIFCISDLHMGCGDARDNFHHMNTGKRPAELNAFLDFVESCKGRLYIVGDAFELWQSNMSRVITHNIALLDRLSSMEATYILGNHDIDLRYFITGTHDRAWLAHTFFCSMCTETTIQVGSKRILLIHGHEQDSYCKDDKPGIGRISAIYTGLKEDRNDGPLKTAYETVEAMTLNRLGWPGQIKRWLLRQPSHTMEMRREMVKLFEDRENIDAIIYGHTHEPGQFQSPDNSPCPIYNCGTWAETVCSFAHIYSDGQIQIMDWHDGKAFPNFTILPVS